MTTGKAERGDGRALVAIEAVATGPRDRRTSAGICPQASFVVQMLACREGLNGYRARRRVASGVGARTYAAMGRMTAESPVAGAACGTHDVVLQRTLAIA